VNVKGPSELALLLDSLEAGSLEAGSLEAGSLEALDSLELLTALETLLASLDEDD
jgi:hypothetical protein